MSTDKEYETPIPDMNMLINGTEPDIDDSIPEDDMQAEVVAEPEAESEAVAEEAVAEEEAKEEAPAEEAEQAQEEADSPGFSKALQKQQQETANTKRELASLSEKLDRLLSASEKPAEAVETKAESTDEETVQDEVKDIYGFDDADDDDFVEVAQVKKVTEQSEKLAQRIAELEDQIAERAKIDQQANQERENAKYWDQFGKDHPNCANRQDEISEIAQQRLTDRGYGDLEGDAGITAFRMAFDEVVREFDAGDENEPVSPEPGTRQRPAPARKTPPKNPVGTRTVNSSAASKVKSIEDRMEESMNGLMRTTK